MKLGLSSLPQADADLAKFFGGSRQVGIKIGTGIFEK